MKSYLSKNKIIQNIIMLLTIVLLSSFIIFYTYSKGNLIFLGITLLILFFSILQNGFSKKIRIGKYYVFIGMFILYCFLSSAWSVYPERAIRMGVTIFEILICFSVLYSYYSRFDSIKKLLLCISWASVCVALYTIYFYGIGFILNSLSSGRRLDNDFANINTVSEMIALGVVIMFYYIFYEKKYKYFPFVVINIFIIAASGSRKSLIIPIVGCFLITMIKNLKNKNFLLNIIKVIVLGIVFCIVVKLILQMPAFEMINSRIEGMIASFTGQGEVDNSAFMRKNMILLGWEQFKKTPFLGIGIGNSGPVVLIGTKYDNAYLHNNFIELLACGGIIGFLIYYNMYFYIFFNFFKNWKYKTDVSIVCMVLCFCLFIKDYSQVSYYSKSTYFYFMIFFLCISELKKRKYTLRKKKKNKIKNN